MSVSAVERAFATEFGTHGAPTSVHSAPGRVNLIGGHTDYNDGFVLPAAIDRRTVVAARPRTDDVLRVHSLALEETVSGPATAPTPRDAAWANYVFGVAWALEAEGHAVPGADVVVGSDVPMGAGLASSAALELAAAATLADLADATLDRRTLATLSRRAENEFVGVSCGLMDQYAAAFGRRDRALFLDCRERTHEHLPLAADHARLVVTDTRVEHELLASAYNRRVAECETGVERLDDLLDHEVTALRDVSVAEFTEHGDRLPATVRRRVEHVVRENDRVRRARDALADGDLAAVGDLMTASHESLRDRYEVSCDELDAVVEVAAEHPAVYGSRMTGAGFGGCVLSLVEPAAVSEVVSRIETGYRERTGVDPSVYVFAAAAGLADERAATD